VFLRIPPIPETTSPALGFHRAKSANLNIYPVIVSGFTGGIKAQKEPILSNK
jgi:hypothetical protein